MERVGQREPHEEEGRGDIVVERQRAGRVVLHFSGELDILSVTLLAPTISSVLDLEARSVAVEMSGLSFMDSSGINVLLRIADRFGPLDVLNASPTIREIIRVTGITEILRIPGVSR